MTFVLTAKGEDFPCKKLNLRLYKNHFILTNSKRRRGFFRQIQILDETAQRHTCKFFTSAQSKQNTNGQTWAVTH